MNEVDTTFKERYTLQCSSQNKCINTVKLEDN